MWVQPPLFPHCKRFSAYICRDGTAIFVFFYLLSIFKKKKKKKETKKIIQLVMPSPNRCSIAFFGERGEKLYKTSRKRAKQSCRSFIFSPALPQVLSLILQWQRKMMDHLTHFTRQMNDYTAVLEFRFAFQTHLNVQANRP